MTYRPLTIGVDLNNVVLDTRGGLHKLCCEISGAKLPANIFAGKNLVGGVFPSVVGEARVRFTHAHYDQAKTVFFESRRFHEVARPFPGAVRALQIARRCGHTIKLVTDVRGLPETTLEHWWRDHHLPACEMILTRGKVSKAGHYKPCNVVIDNEVKHLIPLLTVGGPRLLHMLPVEGAVGSKVVVRPDGTSSQITSVRGWSDTLHTLREVDPALAA